MIKNIGKYRIERLIGQGSTSLVYLAHDPNLSNQLAIKVFDAQLDDTSKEMQVDFLKESEMLFSLSSAPHVISFMEFDFTASGQAYIVMPYFQRSLGDLLGTSNKLSIKKTLNLTQQILSALCSIHQAGLIHRDIKPSNILLDDNDQVQVADFGISMSSGKLSNTQTQMGVGSLFYASPEQLNGDTDVTIATDIYALSALMYRCLSGTQFTETKLPLNTADPDFDEELCRIIDLGLSDNPSLRPSSALEYSQLIGLFMDKLSQAMDAQQTPLNEAKLDPERTRVWEPQVLQNDEVDQLKTSIEALLLEEGEVSQTHFSRLALLAEAELNKHYSDEWLIQIIQQTKTQLSLQNKQAAKFFVWIDKLNAALAHGEGSLKIADRDNLVSLAEATLSRPKSDLIHIIERKSSLLGIDSTKTDNALLNQKGSYKKGRLVFVLLMLVCILAIPWFFTLNKTEVPSETLALSNNQQALNESQQRAPSSEAQPEKTIRQTSIVDLSAVRIADSARLEASVTKIRVIVRVQPEDADVVIQSIDGLPVSNENLRQGEYRLRISKNGYKTVSKTINITTNSLLIDDRLQLGDTRYFIGNTQRTVADGIPAEFILLPQMPYENKAQDGNAISNKQALTKTRVRMMSFEVTNQLYLACVEAGKCATSTKLSTDPRHAEFAKLEHPVINVSWYDINERFIPWLASQTGSNLRLPTLQEWEFAAANKLDISKEKPRYSWGQEMLNNKAHCKNCNARLSKYESSTMPVRSFTASDWQLYDLHGNVQEWTSTCAEVAPSVSSSNTRLRCDLAIVKGGSWLSTPEQLSISYNNFLKKTVRSHTTGFRLVEEVNFDQ